MSNLLPSCINERFIKLVAVVGLLAAAALTLLPVWGLPLLIKYYSFLHGAVLVRPH